MAQPETYFAEKYEAGNAWLADCSAHPDLVRKAWNNHALAPITSGEHWLVAECGLTIAMSVASRIPEKQRGPVLVEGEQGQAWWLVPLDAAEELADVRQLEVQPAGWVLDCPPMDVFVDNRFWLWRPDGSGHLTDPTLLAAVFGPGGYRPTPEIPA
ncbi:hypothetical protein [Streptomyces sp. NPDC002845]